MPRTDGDAASAEAKAPRKPSRPAKATPRGESFSRQLVLAVVLLSASVGLLGGAGAAWALYAHFGPVENFVTQSIGGSGGRAAATSDLVNQHSSAVVSIVTQAVHPQSLSSAAGTVVTGAAVSSDGLIVTSSSAVVGATRLRVGTADGHGYDASVVATDTLHGVVLLRAQGAQGLPTLIPSKITVGPGDALVLVARPPTGAPVAETATVVSTGVEASLGAGPAVLGTTTLQLAPDAALTGAPVLDGGGALYGLILGGSPGSSTISMAPVAAISALINASGPSAQPDLTFGATTVLVTPAVAAAAGFPPGALVVAVTPGGPAASAGLTVGVLITSVNGSAVDADHPFDPSAFGIAAGGTATLTVVTTTTAVAAPVTSTLTVVAAASSG